jgi:hypothetical protein
MRYLPDNCAVGTLIVGRTGAGFERSGVSSDETGAQGGDCEHRGEGKHYVEVIIES